MKSTEAHNILQCFSFFMESKIKMMLIFLYGLLVWINFHMLIRITEELKIVFLEVLYTNIYMKYIYNIAADLKVYEQTFSPQDRSVAHNWRACLCNQTLVDSVYNQIGVMPLK